MKTCSTAELTLKTFFNWVSIAIHSPLGATVRLCLYKYVQVVSTETAFFVEVRGVSRISSPGKMPKKVTRQTHDTHS